MKRVIIAAVMVLLLIVLSAASDIIISRQMKEIYNDAKSFNENSEKLSEIEIRSKSKTIISKWKSAEKLLEYFDSHDKYEEIRKHFGLLELNATNSNGNEITKLMKEIQNLINNYIESRKISLHNVLFITKQLQ